MLPTDEQTRALELAWHQAVLAPERDLPSEVVREQWLEATASWDPGPFVEEAADAATSDT